MEYVEAFKRESFGDGGAFGLKILIATDHELTEDEKPVFYRMNDEIEAVVMAESIRRDPKSAEQATAERASLIALFPCPIFVEALPNGYCSRWCCKHLPWFQVTTPKGRITIGWRKRVISISWEPSVAALAEDVFPAATSTKFDRTIHAWSLPEAHAMIAKLLEAEA